MRSQSTFLARRSRPSQSRSGTLLVCVSLLTLLLIATALPTTSQGDPADEKWADQLFTQALYLVSVGVYPQAESLLVSAFSVYDALHQEEKKALVAVARGQCCQAQGRHGDAVSFYELALPVLWANRSAYYLLYANTLYDISLSYKALQEAGAALLYLKEAVEVYTSLNLDHEVAMTLNSMGVCQCELGQYDEGIGNYERSLSVFDRLGELEGVALCLFNLGLCHFRRGKYELASVSLLQSCDLYADLKLSWDQAHALEYVADSYRHLYRHSDALSYFDRALVIYRTLGEDIECARLLIDLGLYYNSLSLSETAIPLLREALTLSRSLRQGEGEFSALAGLAACYVQQGRYEEALPLAREAHTLSVELRFAQGEAMVLALFGLVYEGMALHEEAMASIKRSISFYESLGKWDDVAMGYNNLAGVYQGLGVYDKAQVQLAAALDVLEKVGDPYSKQRVRATVVSSIALVYRLSGLPLQAAAAYQEALDLYTAMDLDGGIAWVLGNLGLLHKEAGSFDLALEAIQQSFDLFGAQSLWHMQADALRAMGECWYAKGDLFRAQQLFEESRALLVSHGPEEGTYPRVTVESNVLKGLGLVCEAHGDYETAATHLRESVRLLESVQSQISVDVLRQAFFAAHTRDVYSHAIRVVIELRAPDAGMASLGLAERSRARTFLDLLAKGPIQTMEEIAEEGIRTGVVEVSAIEFDLAEVVAGLPPDTAALEYFVTDNATYLWLVCDGSTSEPIRIEVDRSSLREQVLSFRTAVETTSTGLMDAPDETLLTLSRDLYELLIAPVEEQLEGIDHLVIVPSGPLYYLPFCALIDCPDCAGLDLLGGEYLIERYALSYTPSLTTLKYAQASNEGLRTDPLLLALADPDSGDPELLRLPGAQSEVASVAELFNPSEVYVDTAATEDVVASRASSADHLLLSTHGVFNPLNPMFSYLLLAPSEGSDGRLYTHEVFSLDLRTDLVTLSACETLLPAIEDAQDQVRAVRGVGEEEDVELTDELLETLTAGDEIVGLTRAFIYAGTPSVLSSLWRVVSETTEQLMVAFYGYLTSGLDKAEALRRAQRDVMASYPHPRYWAAFSLIGDWRSACDLACQTGGKLSFSLLEAVEDWIKEGSSRQAPPVAVLVTLREGVSEATTQAIASVSDDIQFEGGFGRFIQLTIPLSDLVTLSHLSEVEQISEPPAMSTTP